MRSNPGTIFWLDIFTHLFVVKIVMCLKRLGNFFLKKDLCSELKMKLVGRCKACVIQVEVKYYFKRFIGCGPSAVATMMINHF